MRKRAMALFTVWVLVLGLSACTADQPENQGTGASQAPTWQGQYDLGVRYLSEGNYEQAIIAFTAAIEIDPKRAPAYVGRGDTYVKSGETESNLEAAKADYEKAIELDETSAKAYLGLADVYIRQGDYKKALEVLREGLEKTGNDQQIGDKIDEIQHLELDETFCNSDVYVNSTALEKGQLQLIIDTMQLLQDGDLDNLQTMISLNSLQFYEMTVEVANFENYQARQLRTMINDYKVQIAFSRGNVTGIDGNSDQYVTISVESRPEYGNGYYCEIHIDPITVYTNLDYTYGNCENWNWNGSFNHERLANYSYGLEKSRSTGTVIDGLLDGEVFVRIADYTGYTSEHYETYSDGKLVGFWDGDNYMFGYIFKESGEKFYNHATSDIWENWYCTYQTGANSSKGIVGTYDLLWD